LSGVWGRNSPTSSGGFAKAKLPFLQIVRTFALLADLVNGYNSGTNCKQPLK